MRHIFLRALLAFALVAGVTVASQPTARADDPSELTAVVKLPLAYPGQTKPLPGQLVTITGDIGTDGPRAVTLQKYTTKWSTYSSGITADDGTFSFDASTTSATRRFRVIAAATSTLGAVTTTEVTVTTLADAVSLSVFRAGNTLQITGQVSIPLAARGFALQYKSGSSWIPVTTDPVALAADAAGLIKAKTGVDGSKTYRLLGAAIGSLPVVASNSVAFSASPATLGKNVIYVTTDGGGTPTTKGKDYPGTATLVSGDTVDGPYRLETIAVRGNSSASKPKKPYKLKFAEKQKPFSMKSDKTWVLLANYVDRTLVRSKVAYDLGKKQSGSGNGLAWTSDSKFTELFINGKYIGSYQITQSIKIDSNRVPADKKYGQVIENDPHYASDGVPGFKGLSGQPFSFKDPDEWKTLAESSGGVYDSVKKTYLDPEGLTSEKVTQVTKRINVFEAILYGQDKKKDWSTIDPIPLANCSWADFTLTTTALSTAEWAKAATCDWEDFLDMASAVDYILVREFTKDNDADFYRSNFFWVKDYRSATDKLRMGPVWDFDRSAGAHDPSSTNIQLPTGWWTNGSGSANHNTNKIHWFTRIWKDSRFVAALKTRWNIKKADYEAVATGDNSGVNLAVAQLDDPAAAAGATDSQVAANDRAKWGSSGSRYKAKSSTYKGEVAWLKDWYAKRYAWMEDQITNKL